MKNIVLISLPRIDTAYPPGALAVLSGVAKQNQYDVRIFDYNLDLQDELSEQHWNELDAWCMFSSNSISQDLEQNLVRIFLKNLPTYVDVDTKFVCFSVFSYFSNRITDLLMPAYKKHFDVTTIVGGSGVSTTTSASNSEIFGEHLRDANLADYVVFGEGEIAFDHLLRGSVCSIGININNPVQIDELSALPLPTYEYFDMSRYQTQKILITGSRGCVRKCTFCDVEVTWPKFRYRSANHVVEEIKKHFFDHGITDFEFTDSLINGSITNFNKFNELLYEEKQKNPSLAPIRYKGQFICRPQEQQKPLMYELMHLAGNELIITGIESFSQPIRDHMRKKFSNDDIDYHFEQCARWGLKNVLLMIVGYPTETLLDHQANIDALHRYKHYAKMGTIFMVRWGLTMHLYDHTPIMSMVDSLGINLETSVKYDSVYGWSSSSNPGNTLKERIRRRVELHELSVKLGYPMPRVREELMAMKKMAETVLLPQRKIIPIGIVN